MTVRLDVEEQGAKKKLETPGGEAVLQRLGGEHSELPFYAFVNAKGELIVNSNRDGKPAQNIGYPGAPREIDWFGTMLKRAAPTLPAEQIATLKDWLRRHAPAAE